MKKFISGISWVNLLAMLAQGAALLPPKPWILALQGALAALLPSLGGVGHKVVFGREQDPDKE